MLKTFTDDNFQEEVMKSDVPVLVDFWAPWCGPCQIMTPIINKLATEYEGKAKIGKLNVDDEPNKTQEYGVMGIPAFKIFKNGAVVDEFTGAMSEEDVKARIDQQL
ncbi:MAG: thioredoxin [Candidatus Gracilibacteria bacterium]|jgi:thioredoxin 1|nr:thioredoxin [Candidatus Gracilibacteria bacterium]